MSSYHQYVFYLFCLVICISCQNNSSKKDKVEKSIPDSGKTLAQSSQKSDERIIIFFGNSLTAGFGLEEGEDFPSLIQQRIDSTGYDYKVVNAGLSGETSSGGKERISWVLRKPVEIFVLELGPNDMLRGLDLDVTKENLQGIIDILQKKSPNAKLIIAGMQSPPNMGEEYAQKFAKIYPDLAKDNNADLIPFLLQRVAGHPELNLQDGKHPNAQGQKIVADNVWKILQKHL